MAKKRLPAKPRSDNEPEPEHPPNLIARVIRDLRARQESLDQAPEFDNHEKGVLQLGFVRGRMPFEEPAQATVAVRISSSKVTELLSALLKHASTAEFTAAASKLPAKKLVSHAETLQREAAYLRWEKNLKGVSLRGLSRTAAINEINRWVAEKSTSTEFDSASNNRRDQLAKCFREIRDILGCALMHGTGRSRKRATIRTYKTQDGTNRKRFIVEQSGGDRSALQTDYGIPAIIFE